MPLTREQEIRLMKTLNKENSKDYAEIIDDLSQRLNESKERRHQLRKKLNILRVLYKQQSYEECHDCKKFNADFRNAATQTDLRESTFIDKQECPKLPQLYSESNEETNIQQTTPEMSQTEFIGDLKTKDIIDKPPASREEPEIIIID